MKNIYWLGLIITVALISVVVYLVTTPETNEITVTGSTTVQPIAESLAQAYMIKHPDVTIKVQGGDSNVGIQSAKSGSADIGTVSRNLTEKEGEGLTQYKIGNDGIAIIVNPKNPLNNLNTSQLQGVYDGQITNWNQLGWDNKSIEVVTRETGSGTRLAFEDILFGGPINEKNVTVGISTYQVLHDVAIAPNSIGYVARNSLNPDVKVLMIDNIPLTKENVVNGKYTLQRPLYFLTKGTTTGNVKDFIDFALSPEGQSIINNTEYNSSPNLESLIGPSGGI